MCANVEHFLKILLNENSSAQNDMYSVLVHVFKKLYVFICLCLHMLLEIAYTYMELLLIVASSTGKVYLLMFIYLFGLNIFFLPCAHISLSVKEKKN